MTVILVLATFLAFIVVDWILSRREVKAAVAETSPAQQPETAEVGFAGGYHIPESLRYHPGHAWLLRERKNVMRIGINEFAAALAGRIDKIELPKPGQWLRQGQKGWSMLRAGQKAEMLSPVEGEVVEINPEVLQNPALLREDPYGKGWLMTVFAPDEEASLRNLLPTELVKSWMQQTVDKLYTMQPSLAGATAADGGRPADDLSAAIPDVSWAELTRRFFVP